MKVTIDARAAVAAYSQAFQRLKQLDGFSQSEVLRAEAGSILRAWAGRTKVAKPKAAEIFARYRAGKRSFGYTSIDKNPFGITVNTGRRDGIPGMVWFRTQGTMRMTAKGAKSGRPFQLAGEINDNGTFTPTWIHFRRSDWDKIDEGAKLYAAQLAKLLPAAQKAIGLARQSVVQIADDLGIRLEDVAGGGASAAQIAKARAAIASNGSQYKNGSGTQGGNETTAFVELITRYPLGTKLGMDTDLAWVLARRAKYLETSYERGAFSSIEKTMAAFPNVFRQQQMERSASVTEAALTYDE